MHSMLRAEYAMCCLGLTEGDDEKSSFFLDDMDLAKQDGLHGIDIEDCVADEEGSGVADIAEQDVMDDARILLAMRARCEYEVTGGWSWKKQHLLPARLFLAPPPTTTAQPKHTGNDSWQREATRRKHIFPKRRKKPTAGSTLNQPSSETPHRQPGYPVPTSPSTSAPAPSPRKTSSPDQTKTPIEPYPDTKPA